MFCYKCNHKFSKGDKIFRYKISDRGYGSIFDMAEFKITLCDKCNREEYKLWFNEQPECINEYCEDYKYEKNIEDLLKSFSIENQERIYNNGSFSSYSLPSDIWIAIEKGEELADEIYEEYNLYSPKQIKTYNERFPTCDKVYNIIYSDKYKSSNCLYGASGYYNAKTSNNICVNCNKCDYYNKKTNENIKELTYNEFMQFKNYINAKEMYFKYKDIYEK